MSWQILELYRPCGVNRGLQKEEAEEEKGEEEEEEEKMEVERLLEDVEVERRPKERAEKKRI